jgi:ATP-dependent RNA helicase DHX57
LIFIENQDHYQDKSRSSKKFHVTRTLPNNEDIKVCGGRERGDEGEDEGEGEVRRREEGGGKREEGGGKREEGGRRREEGGGRREEGERRKEGGGRREEEGGRTEKGEGTYIISPIAQCLCPLCPWPQNYKV